MLAAEGSVGVAPEVNQRNPLHSGNKAHKWENPSWLLNQGQTSPEVQSRGDSLTTDLHWNPHSAPEENKFIIHRQEIQVIMEEKGHRLCGRKLCQVQRHNVTSCRDFGSGKLSPCERIFRQDIISIAKTLKVKLNVQKLSARRINPQHFRQKQKGVRSRSQTTTRKRDCVRLAQFPWN